LPLGILHADCDRDACRFRRAGPQDRKLLEHDLQIRIVLDQRQHVGQGPFAEAAAIVEELNEGDIAVRIAERDLMRRGEQRCRIVGDSLAVSSGGFGSPTGRRAVARVRRRRPVLEDPDHYFADRLGVLNHITFDDFAELVRMRRQIILDDRVDLLAHVLRVARGRGEQHQSNDDRATHQDCCMFH
jgi:hypothetical protein